MDIHRCEQKLGWMMRKIDAETDPGSRGVIMAFHEHLLARGLAVATRQNYLSLLYIMAGMLKKPFADATKGDVMAMLAHIEGNGYTVHTKEHFRRCMKKFFTWYGHPEFVEEVRTMSRAQIYEECVPKVLLTREETRKIIGFCRKPIYKTLLALMAETGARIGEILSLRSDAVVFGEPITKLLVSGKTGSRWVFLVHCRCDHPNLAVNLLRDLHDPRRKYVFEEDVLGFNENVAVAESLWKKRMAGRIPSNRETSRRFEAMTGVSARMWFYYKEKGFRRKEPRNRPINYRMVQWIFDWLQEKCREEGMTKRIHPHLFRHSRAGMLYNWLGYFGACDYMGWKRGSEMPFIYARGCDLDIQNSLLKGYGMRPIKPEKLCFWCGASCC